MAGVAPSEIDLVILTTATKRQLAPAGAPQVADRLGITAAGAFDLNAVCAGFGYALAMASSAVRCGQAGHVLVVGSERLTDTIDGSDPDTFVVFGDGAGAVVVSRSEEMAIGPAVWGCDGSRSGLIEINPRQGRDSLRMNGPPVYKWSTGEMPAAAREACALAGVELSDIEWFVPHQANRRIIDTLARELGIPGDRVARDVVDTGNTSSASIPLALSRLMENGTARTGDLALLLGFGSGLSHAGQVVRIP
jgi:3-oxoacyl-[acyl-carrier-protein] synthase III